MSTEQTAEQQPPQRFVARGARVGNSKLTEKKVRTLRLLYAEALRTGDKTITMKSLARKYGICKEQVKRILHRQQWQHVA